MEEHKFTYFQYQKDLDLPIYIRLELSHFSSEIIGFLTQMRFQELSTKEADEAVKALSRESKGRLLTIEEASPLVSRQIDTRTESDRYGAESVIPREGYRVYRYSEVCLMIFSYQFTEWRLGCYEDFGSGDHSKAYRSVINRFISYAMVPLGIIGFWGVPVDEGMVVLKQNDSVGEAVFVDVRNRRLVSVDGVKSIHPRFKILRLDPNIQNRNIRMSSEELVSFLSTHTTFFDYEGLTVPVRQMIQSLSKLSEGLIHPKDAFKPRTDLSL